MHESITEHVHYERGKNNLDRNKIKAKVDDSLNHIETQLEELLHLVGDRKKPATEDEIMNYVIGMIEGVKIKRDLLHNAITWQGFLE